MKTGFGEDVDSAAVRMDDGARSLSNSGWEVGGEERGVDIDSFYIDFKVSGVVDDDWSTLDGMHRVVASRVGHGCDSSVALDPAQQRFSERVAMGQAQFL